MPALDTLTIEVVADTKSATSSINSLARAVKNLSDATGNAGAIGSLTSALRGLADAANQMSGSGTELASLASGIKKIATAAASASKAADSIRQLTSVFAAINDASRKIDLSALAPITDFATSIGTAGTRLERFAVALERLAKFGADSAQMQQALQGIDAIIGRLAAHKAELDALSVTLGNVSNSLKAISRAGDVSAQVERVKKSMRGAGTASASFARNLVKMPWEHLKSKIGGLVKPLQNLVHSFARIAMYRALRTAIKAITQGFSEGIKHLYQWSELVGNNFKQSMDSLATSAHYLRDSLGAMASPLIDALAPAIEVLVEKFVTLLNTINQFVAVLTGQDTWRRAVRTATEYDAGIKDAADSTKEATEAQKKLNKALQDFDELNLITTSTTKGTNPTGSGNNNDSGIDSTHFVEEPVADWIKGIKDAIERGEWYEAGNMLADKLNGLIDNFDAEEFGKNVGQKIQHGIEFYLGFMKNTHWDTLGGKLADFLNAIVGKVNPNDLGEAIVAKFNAAIDFLAGFTKKFDWEEAGKWLADVIIGAFTGLNWGTLGTLIGDLAGGLLDMLDAGFDELLNRGGEVMDSIGDFFSGLGWDGLSKVVKLGVIVGGFKLLFSAIFGDAGLIASVKSSVGGMFSDAGLSNGITFTVFLALAWAASGIAENIEKYGLEKGLWMSFGILDPEVQIYFKADDSLSDFVEKMKEAYDIFKKGVDYFGGYPDASDLPNLSWINGLAFLENVTKGIDLIKEAFSTDPKNLPFFKRALEIVNAFRKLIGLSEMSWEEESNKPGYDKPSVSSSTPGAQWDSLAQEWFVPQIDTTAQTAALQAVQEAAKGARKGIQELSPTDDEVTAFKGQIDKERDKLNGSKYSIKSSASSAHSGINAIKPADNETTQFANALKPWKKKLDGNGKNDGSLVQGANNAKSALDNVSKGTYNPVVKVTTSGYSDVVKKLNNLPSSKTYTIEFKPIIDKKTTGSLMSGSGNTANFTLHLASGMENVPQGTMFVAGEVPGQAEFVGNINGKTGVASGREITGIADAVRDTGATEADLLRQQNQLLRQLLQKSGNVTLAPTAAAGKWVAQSQAAYARATGG